MKHRKTDSSIWDEVVGFEKRLRMERARMQTRNVELASLFSGVAKRRKSRSDVTQVFPEGWKSARGPEVPAAGSVLDRMQRTSSPAPAAVPRVVSPSAAGPGNVSPAALTAPPVVSPSTTRPAVASPPAPRPAVVSPSAARSAVVSPKGGAPGSVLSVTRIGGSVAMLQLAKPPGLTFRAGQHLKISLPGGGRNPYSIASAPSDPTLDLCVERIPGGRVSSQLYALEPGSRLEFDSQPKGSFVLQPSAAVHLMLATVTGIAPFRSMLREAAAKGDARYFVVLHGASFADELPYRAELEALAQRMPERIRYLPSVSRPTDLRNRNFQGLTGRLTDLAPSLVRELQASRAGKSIQVYACGHPDMVSTVSSTLGSMGFDVTSEVFD